MTRHTLEHAVSRAIGLAVLMLLAALSLVPALGCSRVHVQKSDFARVDFVHCGHPRAAADNGEVVTGCSCTNPVIVDSLDAATGKTVRTYYCDGKVQGGTK